MKEKIIFKKGLIDLAQPRLGTKVVYKTDDFFASANRIIDPNPPIFKEGVYDKHGKWMDGWESRRKRVSGHDYLILKLGKVGSIERIEIDTSHFNGNQPDAISVEGAYLQKAKKIKDIKWQALLSKKKVKANNNHIFNIKNKNSFSHIKLNIFPDGGVARIRLFGKINQKLNKSKNKTTNLASLLLGASIIACNNEHFGKAENILAPGKAKNMGDGWETRRRRGKGFDWLILKCVDGYKVNQLEVSTHHFKGNFPSQCSIQAAYINKKINDHAIVKQSNKWKIFLGKSKLAANKTHVFKNLNNKNGKVNFIKINIYPDGGISRFKIIGKML